MSTQQINLGDRATWKESPSWWNPKGETVRAIEDDQVYLNFWRSPIYANLVVKIMEN